MPNLKQPQLRLHKRGQWYCRWGNHTWYFGRDKSAAEQLFFGPPEAHDGNLANWLAYRDRMTAGVTRRRQTKKARVADLVEAYLDHLGASGRSEAHQKHSRSHLRRFTNAFGNLYAHELDLEMLEAFAADLARLELSPKTRRHDIVAIKGCLKYAARRHRAPRDLIGDLEFFEPPRVPKQDPTVIPMADIVKGIARARRHSVRLAISLELQLLTICRPSEIVRISRDEGSWTPMPPAMDTTAPPRCVYSLPEHKTARASGLPRRIVMSGQAVQLVDRLHALRTPWPDQNAYAKSARDAGIGFQPRHLRSSGASHLRWAQVAEADVDQLLGHARPGAGQHYIQAGWPTLLRSANQLAQLYELASNSHDNSDTND